MNNFGGNWTQQKIRIVEEYAKAYLQIMKEHPYWKLLYFDGFAGSGEIQIDSPTDSKIIEGAAKRIVSINEPKKFDVCYFVELNSAKAKRLRDCLRQIRYTGVFVKEGDCNQKLLDLAGFLKNGDGKKHKVLAFIDPCGMQVNWSAIEALKGLSIDMWLLVPTGIGVNRLLMKNHKVPDAWWNKLESFYGLSRDLLDKAFYNTSEINTLFGTETVVSKVPAAVNKIEAIYKDRLKEVFKYVSHPYVMRNVNESIMFHFVLASNNQTAVKIANDMVKKINQQVD